LNSKILPTILIIIDIGASIPYTDREKKYCGFKGLWRDGDVTPYDKAAKRKLEQVLKHKNKKNVK
jgi:hypothetical protein